MFISCTETMHSFSISELKKKRDEKEGVCFAFCFSFSLFRLGRRSHTARERQHQHHFNKLKDKALEGKQVAFKRTTFSHSHQLRRKSFTTRHNKNTKQKQQCLGQVFLLPLVTANLPLAMILMLSKEATVNPLLVTAPLPQVMEPLLQDMAPLPQDTVSLPLMIPTPSREDTASLLLVTVSLLRAMVSLLRDMVSLPLDMELPLQATANLLQGTVNLLRVMELPLLVMALLPQVMEPLLRAMASLLLDMEATVILVSPEEEAEATRRPWSSVSTTLDTARAD